MPNFAANLSMMFQEVGFLDRFEAAARVGFKAVEYLFPYEHPPADIASRLREHHLTQALFNMPPGDWANGERGIGVIPGREDEFLVGVDRAIEYAIATGCRRLHAMAGNFPPGGLRDACEATYIANLRRAAERAAPHGIAVLIEPINTRDMPGYYLNTTTQALSVLDKVGRDNVRLQLDLYHCAIMEGDLAMRIRNLSGRFAHVQIAGVPERHEPDHGEVHFPYLFEVLDKTGFDGWVGCEYRPAGNTVAGLGWARRWGIVEPLAGRSA